MYGGGGALYTQMWGWEAAVNKIEEGEGAKG